MHPAWLRCGKGYIQRVCAPFRALPGGRLDSPKPDLITLDTQPLDNLSNVRQAVEKT